MQEKNREICSNCGNHQDLDDMYCGDCGEKIKRKQSSVSNEVTRNSGKSRRPSLKWLSLVILPLLLIAGFFGVRSLLTTGLVPISIDIGEVSLKIGSEPENENTQQNANQSIQSSTTKDTSTPDEYIQINENSQITPTAEIDPDLILFEDFESSPNSGFPYFTDEYLMYEMINGEGVLSGVTTTGILPVLFTIDPVLDFYLDVDMTFPNAQQDSRYGVLFRINPDYLNGLNSYYALLIYPIQEKLRMGLWYEEEWFLSQEIEIEGMLNNLDQSNHLRLEVFGSDMTIFLNGEFVNNISQDTLDSSGMIGLFISPSEKIGPEFKDFVAFDNLLITHIPPVN